MVTLHKRISIGSSGVGIYRFTELADCINRVHIVHMINGMVDTKSIAYTPYVSGSDLMIKFETTYTTTNDLNFVADVTIKFLDADVITDVLTDDPMKITPIRCDCNCK